MNEPDTPPGDTPVSQTEERLGQFVADALDRLQRGDAVVVEDLLADRPDLIGHGRELVRDLAAFPSAADRAPVSTEAALPQPFPKDFLVTRLLGEGSYGRVPLGANLRRHFPYRIMILKFPAGCRTERKMEAAITSSFFAYSSLFPAAGTFVDRWLSREKGNGFAIVAATHENY